MRKTEEKNILLQLKKENHDLVKNMEQYANSKIAQLQTPSEQILENVNALSRALSFSQRITGKNNQLFVTHILKFLDTIYDEKSIFSDMPGYRGNMSYKEPVGPLHQSFHNWFVETALSLSINKLKQNFQIWLNQTSMAHFLSHIEPFKIYREVQKTLPFVRPEQLTQYSQDKLIQRETKQVLQTVQNILNDLYGKASPTKINNYYKQLSFHNILHWLTHYSVLKKQEYKHEFEKQTNPIAYSSAQSFILLQQNTWFDHQLQTKVKNELEAVQQREPLTKIGQQLAKNIKRTYVNTPYSSKVFNIFSDHRKTSAKHDQAPIGEFISLAPNTESYKQFQSRSKDPESTFEWSYGLIKMEQWFNHHRINNLTFLKSKKLPPHDSQSILLKNKRTEDITEEIIAPVINRELISQAIIEYAKKDGTQQDDFHSEFTSLKEETQMRPLQQNYVYTQPMRSVVEEERVVKQVQKKEVLEIVRKEVETVIKSKSPIENLSRADYTRISDQVYSSLTRRLMMEKERLGLSH